MAFTRTKQNQSDSQPHDHQTELARTQFKSGRRWGLVQGFRDLADGRRGTGLRNENVSAAAHHGGAHAGESLVAITVGAFFDRIWLAGQHCFVDEKVAAFQNLAVGGNKVAGAENDDIAGNDAFCRNHRFLSVADDAGLKCDGFGKLFGSAVGAVFLDEVEKNAGEDDRVDDDKAGRVAGNRREDARDEKNQDERVSEVVEELEDDGAPLAATDDVGTELREAGGGFGGEAGGGGGVEIEVIFVPVVVGAVQLEMGPPES
jgi:hypothetical protein